MVSKWVITYLQMGYIGVITHLRTIDPNFLGHPSGDGKNSCPNFAKQSKYHHWFTITSASFKSQNIRKAKSWKNLKKYQTSATTTLNHPPKKNITCKELTEQILAIEVGWKKLPYFKNSPKKYGLEFMIVTIITYNYPEIKETVGSQW